MRISKANKGQQRKVIEYPFNLKNIAQPLATPALGLLEAAIGFDKLVGFINPLLHEMVRMSNELNYTLVKLDEVRSKCERLDSSLQTYVKREEVNAQERFSRIQSL